LGADGQASAGPRHAQRDEAQGWAGHTPIAWPQATEKRGARSACLDAPTVAHRPNGAEATLHNVPLPSPGGRAAVTGTKRSFSAATAGHWGQCGVM